MKERRKGGNKGDEKSMEEYHARRREGGDIDGNIEVEDERSPQGDISMEGDKEVEITRREL